MFLIYQQIMTTVLFQTAVWDDSPSLRGSSHQPTAAAPDFGLLLSRFRNKVTQSYEAAVAHLALKKHVPDSNVSTSCARSRVYLCIPDMMPPWLSDCCCHTGVMGWDRGAERRDAPAAEVLRVRPAALFLSGGGSAVVWVEITSPTSPNRSPSVLPSLHGALANANSSLPHAARYLLILVSRGTT